MSSPDNKPPPPLPIEQTTDAPHDNDVLCGRGGCINSHPGNEQYRKFVERKKRIYLTARFKREKRLIASSIVQEIRNLDPPGRFLLKDTSSNNSNSWYDIGDEKARDKTSQALRENAIIVRKEMEEEFRETRRIQAREVAIAAGRDPDEAVANVMGREEEPAAAEGGSGEADQEGIVIPVQSGFGTRSGYGGPLYEAQQHPQSGQHHHQIMPPPTTQWGYSPGAPVPQHPPPPSFDPHAPPHPHSHPPHYAPPGSYYAPPPPHPTASPYHHHHHHPPPPHDPQQPQQLQYPPPPAYHHHNPGMNGWGATAVTSMPPPPHAPPHAHPSSSNTAAPPQQQQQQQQQQHTMPPPPIPAPQQQQSHAQHSASNATQIVPPPQPPREVVGAGGDVPTIVLPPPTGAHPPRQNYPPPRHVQFQSSQQHQQQQQQQQQQQPPQDTIKDSSIPLIINSKKKPSSNTSYRYRHQPRKQPSSPSVDSTESSSYRVASQPQESQQQQYQHHLPPPLSPTRRLSMQPSLVSSLGGGGGGGGTDTVSQCTPLDFMSNYSVKSSDTLSHLFRDMQDEIEGDVGQEVELVAHAPMTHAEADHATDNTNDGREAISPPTSPRNLKRGGGAASLASRSTHHSATPPRHGQGHKSGRRKGRRGNHIPSNSGKVQVDWSAAGRGGTAAGSLSSSSSKGVGLPCGGGNAATCGGILSSPLVGRGTASRRSTMGSSGVTSPLRPMSPVNSLDFDKMSLCGTEIISLGGGSVGGASLCNVFEEHDSVIGASVMMDMSISLGSHPSSGDSAAQRGGGGGIHHTQSAFGGQESVMGASALMDMSVGSGTNSKAASQGSGGNSSASGNQSSGSRGSRHSSRGSGRSISPASIEKSSSGAGGKVLETSVEREVLPMQGQEFKWAWGEKNKE